ncbi:hypothetical protein PLICRDRAFT_52163 [Plicaturopsis crispa FD-325 SS-3]|nr:hypothetical protein PLICRDRAFT_52163 [Plicaturopsis crispa FD-325 SS-3]
MSSIPISVGIFAVWGVFTALVTVAATVTWLYTPLRIKAYRLLATLLAGRLGPGQIEALRVMMGLSPVDVNMPEVLTKQQEVVTGQASKAGSALGDVGGGIGNTIGIRQR